MSDLITPEAEAMIKDFEAGADVSRYLTAYLCPADKPTIGWGHTKTVTREDVRNKRRISVEEAQKLFDADVADAVATIKRVVTYPLNINQISALVSWVFNLGEGNLRASTMLKRINAGHMDAASVELTRWNKATVKGKKVTLPGLVRRRAAEQAMWLRPVSAHMANEQATRFTDVEEAFTDRDHLGQSTTVKVGGVGLTTTGVMVAAETVASTFETTRPVLGIIREFRTELVTVALVMLAAALAFALYRRYTDHRKRRVVMGDDRAEALQVPEPSWVRDPEGL